jgi:hypothetical protein
VKLIPARRASWLRQVQRLAIELHRPPVAVEIAKATGRSPAATVQMVRRATADGHMLSGARASAMAPRQVRIAPAALAALGIPLVVYLAWPGDWAAQGCQHASWLETMGIFAVSPYLVRTEPHHMKAEAAAALAQRADAVVAMTDPLLTGRPDVAAALAAGVPVAIVPQAIESGISSAAAIWRAPFLVPYPQPAGRSLTFTGKRR